jgi:tripartite-type tricarboxylate transporter receptor subunit TctC
MGARGQDKFPSETVRLIVGFSAGGGTDTASRAVAEKLAEMWGVSVVVENRPGADGSIAAAAVAAAPPDGHTIAIVSNAHTITPSTTQLAYDAVESFRPITMLASQPNLLLLHPSLEANTVQELIALALSKPGDLTFGSSGEGTSPYLAMQRFMMMSGTEMVHVPYKGSAPAVLGIVSGEVDLMFGAVTTTLPHVKTGALKAIAVSTRERIPVAPEIPTVAESGLEGFEAASWYGALTPAGTPDEIVKALNEGFVAALTAPDVNSRLESAGFDVVANSSEEFGAIIKSDIQTWGEVIKNIKK